MQATSNQRQTNIKHLEYSLNSCCFLGFLTIPALTHSVTQSAYTYGLKLEMLFVRANLSSLLGDKFTTIMLGLERFWSERGARGGISSSWSWSITIFLVNCWTIMCCKVLQQGMSELAEAATQSWHIIVGLIMCMQHNGKGFFFFCWDDGIRILRHMDGFQTPYCCSILHSWWCRFWNIKLKQITW